MSSKYNQLYGNPALNRALGNIAKTLVGSATDDAAIARANYIDSQTVGQNLKNKNVSGLSETINKLTNSPLGQSFAANMLGGNVDGSGNLVKNMPSSVERSVPLLANQVNMNQEDINAQLSNLAKTIYGDQTYNPNQITSAYNNIKAGGNSSLANNMLMYGNPDEQQRGFKMMGKTPGKFFDAGSSNRAMDLDLEANKYKSDKSLEASQYRTDTNNETTKEDLKQKRIITKELGIKKIEKIAEVAKYKFDNREIKIAVGKDQKVYIDMDTADKLGVEATIENGEEVYVINGKQSQDKVDQVKVNVGKADVFLSKEMADKLGIPVNDQGQYVIKGSGYNDGTGTGESGGKKSSLKPSDVKAALTNIQTTYEKFPDYSTNLPQAVIGNVEKRIFKMIADDLEDGMPRDQAFASNATSVISQGSVQITSSTFGLGDNLYAPKFFIDYLKKSDADKDKIIKFFKSIGYSVDESKSIASFIRDN